MMSFYYHLKMKWSHEVEKHVSGGTEWDLNSGLCDPGAWPINHSFPASGSVFQGVTDLPFSSTAHPQVDCFPVALPAFLFPILVSTGLKRDIWSEQWWSIEMCATYSEALGPCPCPVSLTLLLRTLRETFAWGNAGKAWLSEDSTPNLSLGP